MLLSDNGADTDQVLAAEPALYCADDAPNRDNEDDEEEENMLLDEENADELMWNCDGGIGIGPLPRGGGDDKACRRNAWKKE